VLHFVEQFQIEAVEHAPLCQILALPARKMRGPRKRFRVA
jgi:hypothetical protein